MKSKILLLISLCLLTIGSALGQTITVKGVVLDERGDGVIGATVRLKADATVGTTTGLDGDFTLKAKQGEIIIISYVGYKTQEVAAAPSLTINLKPDTEVLDDVIVVAFGTAKKESFTGSSVVVDSKKLEKLQAPDAVKALEGMVPGLQLSSESGSAGSNTEMRIRGVGSINASNNPLIVVDGAPYDGNINSINPKDIASINVLKDAASAALYGARGANGVIIITTKNGREGQTVVNFEARLGVNQRGVPEYDVVTDPAQFYGYYWEAIRNQNKGLVFGERQNEEGEWVAVYPTLEQANQITSGLLTTNMWDEDITGNSLIGRLGYNIYDVADNQLIDANGVFNSKAKIKYEDANNFNDWASLLMSPKMRQEYNLSLSRGTDKSKTFFSLGYLNDQGYVIKNAFDRISSRLSYETDLYEWLKLSASSQISYTKGNFGNEGASSFSNIFNFTRNIAPIYPVYLHDKDGKIMYDKETGEKLYDEGSARPGINGTRSFSGGKNIIGESELNRDYYERLYINQMVRADIDFGHGFKFNTTFNYYFNNSNTNYFINPKMGDGKSYKGILEKNHYFTNTMNWNQVLTYDTKVGDFTMQGMLGHEFYSWNQKRTFGSKKRTIIPTSLEFNTFGEMSDLISYQQNYKVEGFFGQFTGDYLDKYFLSASLRFDGSSVFAPENRWGTFWSLGSSWRISEEEFMKDVNFVDNLKLRASLGQQGNDNLLDEEGYRMFTPYQTLYGYLGDGKDVSFYNAFKGNPDITWEKNLNLSLGLEFGLFNSRLTGELDFFSRKTTDLLFNEPTERGTGFSFIPMNIGSMRNTGFEFSLSGRIVSTEKVQFTMGLNGMTFKNEILSLPERFKENGLSKGVRILKEGGSINDIYLVKYAGVNPDNGDALYEKFNKETGMFEVVGSANHSNTMKDRQLVGNTIRDLEGGFFANLNTYGVDLSLQFSYGIGGDIVDWNYANLMHTGRNIGTNFHKDIANRWTPENKNTDIPRLENQAQLIKESDRFLTDGSYLSLRSVTLGYTLPDKVIEKLSLKSLRFYVSADNVFLLSRRKGFDPRTSFTGNPTSNQPAVIRTISGGISISL